MKKMRILIKKDGKTEIRVEGGQGDNCLTFTKAIEKALGEVDDRVFCPEYHEEPVFVEDKLQETL